MSAQLDMFAVAPVGNGPEHYELPLDRKGWQGMPLAEIDLAFDDGGWRQRSAAALAEKVEGAEGVSGRRLNWFSEGCASAVATRLSLSDHPDGEVVMCSTGAEDEDNHRFAADCVRWFNAPITTLTSDEYADTWDLWERRNYMAGVNGAICTGEFKFAPRLAYQRPDDIHVFGYTADAGDVARAKRLRETYPEMTIETPLIDRGVTKAGCLAIIQGAGIKPPRTYEMGFPNANCLKSGCVKAVSPDYWALHRQCFPEGFARTAAIARRLGVKLAIVGREKLPDGRHKNIRAFIDDIPLDQPTLNPIAPACDFLCHIAEQDMPPLPAQAALSSNKSEK